MRYTYAVKLTNILFNQGKVQTMVHFPLVLFIKMVCTLWSFLQLLVKIDTDQWTHFD